MLLVSSVSPPEHALSNSAAKHTLVRRTLISSISVRARSLGRGLQLMLLAQLRCNVCFGLDSGRWRNVRWGSSMGHPLRRAFIRAIRPAGSCEFGQLPKLTDGGFPASATAAGPGDCFSES